MRDYTKQPVHVVKDNPTREILSIIDFYLQDLSKGVARIQKGQVPDGSGDTIINQVISDLYWYKPGHTNFGTAFMETAPGGGGVISSTKHSTKGSVYLGTAKTTVYDEVNNRIGIGQPVPTAKLDILVPNPVLQSGTPNTGTQTGIDWANVGGPSFAGSLSDLSDATYARWDGPSTGIGTSTLLGNFSALVDPSTTTGYSIKVTARSTHTQTFSRMQFTISGTTGGTIKNFFLGGPSNDTGAHPVDATLTGTFAEYTIALSGAEATLLFNGSRTQPFTWGAVFSGVVGGTPGVYDVSRIVLSVPGVGGGSAETLQKWETSGGSSNLLDFADDGTGTTQIVFSGTPYMSFANGGLRFNMASPAAGKVWEATDATGTGAWLHPSALATKQVHVWTANGFYRVDNDVDGARTIPRAASATNFILYRRLGGSSGGTGVTLLRNGVSVLSSDPGIAFNAGASATAAGTFSATAWAATSVFTVSATAVDGGRPRDWVALLEVYA